MNPLALAIAVTLAVGQAPTRQAPPAAGTPKPFTLPAREEFKLPNGLEVTLVPYGNIPKVNVQLVARTGNVHEKANEIWLADITADMLEEGTTSRTAEQVNAAAASMGGLVETQVTPDETVVEGEALGEFAAPLVELIADVVRNPRMGQEEFDRIKQDRLRDLAIQKSTPQALAQEAFLGTVYKGHAYGRIFPTTQMLQGYTLEQVKAYYAANLGAQRSHLYVVGQFDAAAIKAAIEKAFSDWAPGPAATPNVPKAITQRAVHILDRPGSVQSTIIMGAPVPDPRDPDYVKLVVMNAILGGSFSSRITSNIRENKGYTYSPQGLISSRFQTAYWAEQADVTTKDTGNSLKEIFLEVDRLQAAPPTEQELTAIKNYLVGNFVLQNSSRGGIIGRLRFEDLHQLPNSYLENYVQNLLAVSAKDVQAMARKINDPQMAVVIVGDKKAIEKQVKPYGKVLTIPPPK